MGSDGTIAVPLVGQVKAASLTVPELKKIIATRLNRDFVVDPKVSIEVLLAYPVITHTHYM